MDSPKVSAPQFDVPLPHRMRGLHCDHRGFIVPFFVAWIREGKAVNPGYGTPDFRVVDPAAFSACVKHGLCWLCGQPMGRHKAFVLGPMCVITRTNSEPPSHRDCAEYAMKVCPFLSRPKMRRNETDFDVPGTVPAPGEHSDANPGIMALWMTDGATMYRAETGRPGWLFTVNDPSEVTWWRESRLATRAEVEEGLAKAMPALEASAARQGREAQLELERCSARALAYLPPEGARP
jgi:hypothetical protein